MRVTVVRCGVREMYTGACTPGARALRKHRVNACTQTARFFIQNAAIRLPRLIYRSSFFFMLQYYEMSYGLNVEMHKQVSLYVNLKFK